MRRPKHPLRTTAGVLATIVAVGIAALALFSGDEPGPIKATAAPAPPALSVTPAAGQVTLTWDPVPNATIYNVWRRLASAPPGSGWGRLDQTAQTRYVDDGLVDGTSYVYGVRAQDASGAISESSNLVSVTVGEPGPGPTPTPEPTPEPSPTATPEPSPTATPEPTTTPTPTPEPTPVPTEGDYLLIPAADLNALPTIGVAWTYLNTQANAARSQITFNGSATDPQLRNYENTGRYGQKILAVAFRYARTRDPADRAFVEKCLRYVIGAETRSSTDGTSASDGLLATMRNLPAYVLSADLIGLDDGLTGSRAGWTGTTWRQWLVALQTKTVGTHGRWKSIVQTSNNSANNWGAAAMASRTISALYLKTVDQALVDHWRRWMGDVTVDKNFQPTGEYDKSWDCDAGGTPVRRPITPEGCGADRAGIVVEDISRSAGGFPNYDGTGLAYSNEHLHFITTAAIAMKRAGYRVDLWGARPDATPTLKLAGDWAQRRGLWPLYGTSNIHRVLPWMLNYLLGTSYPTSPAAMGRMSSYADWWGQRPVTLP